MGAKRFGVLALPAGAFGQIAKWRPSGQALRTPAAQPFRTPLALRWDVRVFQVSGGPGRLDVVANPEGNPADERIRRMV